MTKQRRPGWTAKRSLKISVLFSVLFTLIGCGRNTEPTIKTIMIGTFSRAIDYSPFYIARHFRWFEDNKDLKGIEIKYQEFSDRSLISAALSNNSLAAIFAAEPPMIITQAGGDQVRIVEISCTLQQEIVVRSALRVNSVADLRNRTIAVLQTTSSEYGLKKILAANNLDFNKDVKIQYMGPDAAKAAFVAGKIDAWAVWPPFVEEQQVSGQGKVLTGGDAVIQSVMALPPSLIEKQPAIAKALVTVIQNTKKWMEENPQEAQTIVANTLSLDSKIVTAAWGKHNWRATLTDDVISDIQNKADFLAEAKVTRENIKLNVRAELVDLSFTRK